MLNLRSTLFVFAIEFSALPSSSSLSFPFWRAHLSETEREKASLIRRRERARQFARPKMKGRHFLPTTV